MDEGNFLSLIADSANAATVRSTVQEGKPVPDMQHLRLRAERHRRKRRALCTLLAEVWTAFRRLDAR